MVSLFLGDANRKTYGEVTPFGANLELPQTPTLREGGVDILGIVVCPKTLKSITQGQVVWSMMKRKIKFVLTSSTVEFSPRQGFTCF